MARTAGKKQAPAKIEEDDDEGWEDAVVETDGKEGSENLRLRDWRDVERFREMKDLRRLVDDDYGLEEIFHVPLKPRPEAMPRTSKLVLPAKLQPKPEPVKPAGKVLPTVVAKKGAPAKPAAKAAKPAAAAPKPKPAPKAKAKKR